MKQFNKKYASGFTILELLVVLSIIGLLSSLTFATLMRAREKARETAALVEFKQIQRALEFYYQDKGYYPPLNCVLIDAVGTQPPGCNTWLEFKTALAPYINVPNPLVEYKYDADSADEYQTYGFATYTTEFVNLATSDGGFSATLYEVGTQPAYCLTTYGYVQNASWYHLGNTICEGGN